MVRALYQRMGSYSRGSIMKHLFIPKEDVTYVDRFTRAGYTGKYITCPKCQQSNKVFHFSWSALTCLCCRESINKNDWRITPC